MKARKLVLSLLSMVGGWLAGFLYNIVFLIIRQGYPTDGASILYWTGVFIFIAWVIFVIPLVLLLPEKSRMFSIRSAPLAWACYGLIAFLILLGWWTPLWKESHFLLYACVVGTTAGFLYAFSLRKGFLSNPRWVRLVRLLCGCLVILFLLVWPWLATDRRKPSHYFIPYGYSGWVLIEYGVKGAPSISEESGYYQVKVPSNGWLKTSSPFDSGTGPIDRYSFYDGDKLTPIEAYSRHHSLVHGQSSGIFGCPDDEAPRHEQRQTFFVGTKDRWDSSGGFDPCKFIRERS